MMKRTTISQCTVGFVALTGFLACGTALAGTEMASASQPPAYLDLVGVVRDFHERTAPGGHPDFERQPNAGFGHYAGNVALFLDHGPKPIYTGNGRKVNSNWRNSAGRPIAWHLHNAQFITGAGAPTKTQIILKDSAGAEAYEITWLSTEFNEDNTSTWKYRVRELPGAKHLSYWNLALHSSHQVKAGTTAGYQVGTDSATGIYGIKWTLNDAFTQGEFTLVVEGHYFGMDSPAGTRTKSASKAETGVIFAPTNAASTTGSPFNDGTMLVATNFGDTAGSWGPFDNAGVQSPETFSMWFRDVPGVNMSKAVDVRFVRQSDGTYVFDDRLDPHYSSIGGFFPIDGELFGNSAGSPHNYHFTFEMHTQFTYDETGNQFFQFIGDDDVYVYIDGKLAIDLGGVHTAIEQYADLRRMGLRHGETYSLDFFFAERHRTESRVRMVTNIALQPVVTPSISAAFD